MAHRFFIDPSSWNPQAPRLTGDEARHALQVLRMQPGDAAVVFDGRGNEQAVKMTAAAGGVVEMAGGPVSKSAPLACRITLAQAIPKGKNMDLIVQKATELGAAAVFPVVSARTIVRLERDEAARKQEKWQRVAVEACKQSGQNFLPQVGLPVPLAELLAPAAATHELLVIASLQAGARRLKPILAEFAEMRGRPPASVMMLVGPEGDFTPAEVNQALAAGAQPMTLGPIILRTETAALYCLSVLAHELQ
jgi:16S rRNA (uracil1498-N3)-methyltransferase